MKTQHLRQDKTCLNCGHPVPDRFCGHCGQENVEVNESFGHLVSHFFQDFTHYDSKLLTTLKYLFFYPGLLTREYIAGKRMSYVNPIRLYVFTSFVFFLLLAIKGAPENPYARETQARQQRRFESMVREARGLQDSLRQGLISPLDTASKRNRAAVLLIMGTDSVRNAAYLYDSLQRSLPPEMREDWWERTLQSWTLQLRDQYGGNMKSALVDKLLHGAPKLMFLLLPFFALLLKWFFSGKQWVYGNHAIFSIHLHTFIFMLGILAMLVGLVIRTNAIYAWMLMPVFLYFVFAVRNAYQVRFGIALLKSVGIVTTYLLGTVLLGLLLAMVYFAAT